MRSSFRRELFTALIESAVKLDNVKSASINVKAFSARKTAKKYFLLHSFWSVTDVWENLPDEIFFAGPKRKKYIFASAKLIQWKYCISNPLERAGYKQFFLRETMNFNRKRLSSED